MLRMMCSVLVLTMLSCVSAQGIFDLADRLRIGLGGEREWCSDLGLEQVSAAEWCLNVPRSPILVEKIEQIIQGLGGSLESDWQHKDLEGKPARFAIATLPDDHVGIAILANEGRSYSSLWIYTSIGGVGVGGIADFMTTPAPPPGPRAYVSDVLVEYQVGQVEGSHSVVAISSPLQIVVSTAGKRSTVSIGGVAVAPGVSADEAMRLLTRTLLGQLVYLVDGAEGQLVFFRNADGAWDLGGQRAALVNARLVHEGIYVSDVVEGSFGEYTASVLAAMDNNPDAGD